MASEGTWKAATFALAGVMAGALATAGVLAYRQSAQEPAPATNEAAVPPQEATGAPLMAPPAADPNAKTEPQALAAAPPAAPPSEPPPAPVRHHTTRTRSSNAGAPSGSTASSEPSAPPSGSVQRVATRPSSADVETCNRYATSTADKAKQTIGKALVGGVLGAALGAAGGAIADGGSGAGKGAGIGGLVGAAAGTVYGINQTNQADARAEAAYRECMQRRGYDASYAQY